MSRNWITADEIKEARRRLRLSQREFAERLRLGGDGKRLVRRWEKGEVQASGPVSLAIEYMLREQSK